jgi:RNA-binding protein YlmH
MNTGDNFRVNFGASKNADSMIGAGDIISIEDVYSLKVNGVA